MSRVVVNEIQAKVGNDISFNDAAKIDTLKGKTTAGSITIQGEGTATTNLQQGLIKHWCHFQMNTGAVNDSFNNSSITDQATGQFTMNLTNAMASAGDDLQLVSGVVAVGTYGRDGSVRTDTRLTTSTYDLMASLSGGSFYDVVRFSGGRVGDLA